MRREIGFRPVSIFGALDVLWFVAWVITFSHYKSSPLVYYVAAAQEGTQEPEYPFSP